MHLDYEEIFEQLECAIIVLDSRCLIQQINLAAENMLARSRHRVLGEPLKSVIDWPSMDKPIKQCLENEQSIVIRNQELSIDNQLVTLDITLSSWNPQRRNTRILVELHAINRISHFADTSQQMKRIRAIRMMMRGLAHEVKNPLAGIRGAAQLLRRELHSPSEKQLTDILIKEADRLSQLVDRVIGSREQLQAAAVNIHEVIEHVLQVVAAQADLRLELIRQYDPALPEIWADREQLVQAIFNIVINALEAQADKPIAVIGINTSFDRYVSIGDRLHKQVLRIVFWDHGDGVSEEFADILFDPLVSSKAAGGGLGLAITRDILQRHQGSIALGLREGKTSFSLCLPISAGAQNSEVGL